MKPGFLEVYKKHELFNEIKMKSKLNFIIILIVGIVVVSCGDKGYKIYISPNGNDNAAGEISNPIVSLQHAVELARAKAGKVPVTIYLSGGYYRLTEPLKLGIHDGGTGEAPVKWKAIQGEKPVISGGIQVKNWKQEDDDLWSAKLPKDCKRSFRSFYVNDRRAVRARFPESDFLKVNKVGEDNRTNFFFKKDDFPKVKDIENLELVFMHDWSITRIGVKSINWKSNHIIAVDSIGARLPFFKITGWEKHPRYYLENAIELCDKPGEWYCDFKEQKIYYYPLQDEKIKETVGTIPIVEKLITITGSKEKHVGSIIFDGITFEHTNWQIPSHGYCGIQACMYNDRGNKEKGWNKVPAVIELDLAENCGFYNCTIKHSGGSGIWVRENSSDCVISNSHIYDISGNGINIGEGRDRLVDGMPWWKSRPEQVSINNKISNTKRIQCFYAKQHCF